MKKTLFEMGKEARKYSHSPYSQVQVGSALVLDNDKTYFGANIENASFGATVCAERVAIWKAISENGFSKIRDIVVVTSDGWPPCGMCRQVIAEFGDPNTQIHVADLDGIKRTWTLAELLPDTFTPEHLKK